MEEVLRRGKMQLKFKGWELSHGWLNFQEEGEKVDANK